MPTPPSGTLRTVADLTDAALARLLDDAEQHLDPPATPPAPLAGRSVVLLFFERSTRTRASFEIAAAALGAHPLNLDIQHSSTAKGESFDDTIRTLDAMRPAAIVIRHGSRSAAAHAQRISARPVINAGAGIGSHPTQALLDALTIRVHARPRLDLPYPPAPPRPFAGLRIAVVGDILRSRVARSLIRLFPRLGARLTLVGPPAFLHPRFAALGHPIAHTLHDGLHHQPHIVYTLRVQRERGDPTEGPSNQEYAEHFGLTADKLDHIAPNAFLMHPGPVNRGVELDDTAIKHPRSLILKQVEAGVALRKAVLLRAANANSPQPHPITP